MPICPASVLLFLCATPSLFSPAWAKKKLGAAFFSPKTVFLAQKRFYSAKKGGLRRVLRSPRGFWGS